MSKKLVLVLLAVYLISLAAAEIMISQPLKVYNYGDKLDIKADVRTSEETNGFFELSLECNNIENNFYRVPLNMNGGKTLDTSLLLVPKLGEGLCKIYAFYDGQKDTSQEFEISKELKVQLNTGDIIAEAGKSFTISGTAERENGKKAEGFVEFSLGNDSVKSVGEVKKGFFSSNFSFPENAKSGSYNLAIRVYEEYNNEITNEGTIKKNKGAAYSSNDAIIGIFQANDMLAVRTADAISSMIRKHNKLAKSKVDYGIGVNSGEIIVKREDKLRFSGVGNTIPLAKKIAELSNNEVLLSESINMKVMNEVKTVRKQLNGLNIYNIKDFSNREQYNGFINGFLDRQKK